ncbi:IS256 family transposase, partial [Roseospira navarrensis]|nr:IS256 family transposase [Roseospira navarrensis]MQX38256.1 IS256 family transposase [Roseospira navarrensis]
MQDTQGKVIAALMEQLIQTGPEGMAEAFTALFNLAMRMERDRHLGAGPYERSDGR